MDESNSIKLLLRAAQLLEEGLLLFFPVDVEGNPTAEGAYAAVAPNNPEDIALILHPRAFNPLVDEDDIPCDENDNPIFFSFGKLV